MQRFNPLLWAFITTWWPLTYRDIFISKFRSKVTLLFIIARDRCSVAKLMQYFDFTGDLSMKIGKSRTTKILFKSGHLSLPVHHTGGTPCFRLCNTTTITRYRLWLARFNVSCCRRRQISAPYWRIQHTR